MSKKIIRKKRKGGLGILLLITAVVVAGYFFKDCLPNFGIGGGGSGTSKESGEKDEATQTPKPDNAKNTVAVIIKGEECILDAAPPQACSKTCADLKEKYPAETRIEVNSTVGTQATVDAFKQCVGDAGFKVSIQSE